MSEPKPRVIVYSDGGADPNPGPGGWGVVLLAERDGKMHTKELSGGVGQTTNNRMELTAAIQALQALKESCEVEFHTDSQYLKKGITEWMAKWLLTDFKRGEIQNADLWKQLNVEVARHKIEWHWVKGHAGNTYNERADALASAKIRAQKGSNHSAEPPPYNAYLRVSCSGKVGAWAALITEANGEERLLTGGENPTTANRLDLLGAVAALEAVPIGQAARLYTGNSYLHSGLTLWMPGWKKSRWIKKTGGEVQHRELWERADALMHARKIEWVLFAEDSRPAQIDAMEDALRQAVERARKGP